jgi:catechol 2,3-dioxygenase-like lactoylglutathione lyase family enzyme
MKVLFVTSVAVVAADPPESRRLFIDEIGLPLQGEGEGYYSSGDVAGTNHFGIWPLSEAAQACFGTPQWPADRILPQASVEFEVADVDAVAAAGEELRQAGFELLHTARTEPWGQTVARVLTAEGLIVGISHAPMLHGEPPG